MNKICVLLLSLILVSSGAILFLSVNASETGVENTWETKQPMPLTTSGARTVMINDKIYVFTAEHTYVYVPAEDTWTQKTSMPTPRMGYAIAAVDNKIYVIGGQANAPSAVNEVYDTITDTWETKRPLPESRGKIDASVIGSKIYILGWVHDATQEIVKNSYVYDPAADSWTKNPPPPPTGSSAYHICVIDKKIYMIHDRNSHVHDGIIREGKLFIYDTENDIWTTGASIPECYDSSSIIATTGQFAPKRIYVIGGIYSPSLGDVQAKSVNFVYDPKTDSWNTAAAMPTARGVAGVAVLDDRIYVFGGSLSSDILPGIQTNVVEVYTPIGYGKAPPEAQISSPVNNQTYNSDTVSLEFSLNKPAQTITYNLNSNEPTAILGNTTLTGLTSGEYNLTLTLTDERGNVGTQIVTFFVVNTQDQQTISPTGSSGDAQPALPTTAIIAGVVVAGTVIAVTGVMVYHFKHVPAKASKPN